MNKTAAAAYLGVTPKTVSRHVNSGKLTASYIPGKTGKVLDISQAELDRFKQEQVVPVQKKTGQEPGTVSEAPPIRDLKLKLALKLSEATYYSGFSQEALEDAIQAGALKAVLSYDTWLVRPRDLDKWVKNQFKYTVKKPKKRS